MDYLLIGIAICVALAVFMFEWAMLRSVASPQAKNSKKIKDRIAKLKQKSIQQKQESLVKQDYKDKNSAFYQNASKIPGMNTIKLWIEQSGQSIKLEKLLWTCAIFGIAGVLIGFTLTRSILIALAIGAGACTLPVIQLNRQRIKRLNTFDETLPEALDIMTRALRAGHPFNHSLKLVGEELGGPMGEEMSVTHAELNYGVSVKESLLNLTRRVPSKPLKSLVTAILLQRETGGNLAEILEKIGGVVRGGYKFQRKLKTLSAEGKMSAWVLAMVPIVLGVGMYGFVPDIIGELFTNPKGHNLLYASAVLYIVGFIWIKKVIKIEV